MVLDSQGWDEAKYEHGDDTKVKMSGKATHAALTQTRAFLGQTESVVFGCPPGERTGLNKCFGETLAYLHGLSWSHRLVLIPLTLATATRLTLKRPTSTQTLPRQNNH